MALKSLTLAAFGLLFQLSSHAAALEPAIQSKIDQKKVIVAEWGKDSALVAAVKDLNQNPPTAASGMDQTAWEGLSILDPKVRELQSNKVGAFLRGKKEPWVAEAFVSLANGTKAGFLAKTTSWSHKGKPKHDKPMAGESWQGELEQDQSSGRTEVQVAVPVLDGGTPIGSLIVGIDVSKL